MRLYLCREPASASCFRRLGRPPGRGLRQAHCAALRDRFPARANGPHGPITETFAGIYRGGRGDPSIPRRVTRACACCRSPSAQSRRSKPEGEIRDAGRGSDTGCLKRNGWRRHCGDLPRRARPSIDPCRVSMPPARCPEPSSRRVVQLLQEPSMQRPQGRAERRAPVIGHAPHERAPRGRLRRSGRLTPAPRYNPARC